MSKLIKASVFLLLSSIYFLVCEKDTSENNQKVEENTLKNDQQLEEQQGFTFMFPVETLYKHGFIPREDIVKIINSILEHQELLFTNKLNDLDKKITGNINLSKNDQAKLRYLLSQVIGG